MKLKKLGCTLLLLLGFSPPFASAAPSVACNTDGYTCIMTAADLNEVRNHVNDPNAKYRLGADIDLSSYAAGEGWVPIGFTSGANYYFQGFFDGNGYIIRNLTIKSSTPKSAGLFLDIQNAVISNITLENVDIDVNGPTGGLTYLTRNSSFTNIQVTGSIRGTSIVAPVIGSSMGPVTIEKVKTKTTLWGTGSISGVLANNNSTATMKDVVADTVIKTRTATDYISGAGGFVGVDAGGINIEQGYAKIDIDGPNGSSSIGGVMGSTGYSTIKNVYITGKITGPPNVMIGGLFGALTGSSAKRSSLTNVYSAVSVTGNMYVGGAVGYIDTYSDLTNVFYDTQVSGQSDTGKGTPMTTAQMKTQSTYTGFDFASVWKIYPEINDGYPYFSAEALYPKTNSALTITAPSLTSSFAGVTLNGLIQKTTATLGNVVVADATTLGSGYHIQVSATAFKEPTGAQLSLPTGSLTLKMPTQINYTSGDSATKPAIQALTAPVIDSGAVTIITAAAGQAVGRYEAVFPANALELTLNPATTKRDLANFPTGPTTYQSTITWSVVAGP